MKKRNYVVAISMIALLVQSGGAFAMAGLRQRAAAVKGATVDSLYKRAKDFAKEVKTLKRCHKDKSCTPAQYKKIRRLSVTLGAAAAAAIGAALVGTGLGVGAYVEKKRLETPLGLYRAAMNRFKVYAGNPHDERFVRAAAAGDDLAGFLAVKDQITDEAIRAALWAAGQRGDKNTVKFIEGQFVDFGPRALQFERESEVMDLP